MSDMQYFEDQFARQLRSYAAAGASGLEREAVKRAVAAGVSSRRVSVRRWWPLHFPQIARAALAASLIVVVAVGFAVWSSNNDVVTPGGPTASPSSTSSPLPVVSAQPTRAAVAAFSGRIRSDAAAMPVLTMDGAGLCIADSGYRWEDGLDAAAGMVDIVTTSRSARRHATQASSFSLAAKPPLASGLDPNEEWIEYGMVFDNNEDGTPDFEVGINNSPGGGHYRVWVTDLGRGETVEQKGPPYGSPFEFIHPDEQAIDQSGGPAMSFRFLDGSPTRADLGSDYRYYAWSSYTENGSVVAWDYAPNFGWLEVPACESLPAKGWPDTTVNTAGIYSWEPGRCAGESCNFGFMHGSDSGDVEITLEILPEPVEPSVGGNAQYRTIAGRWALYQRLDAQHEEWFVDIDGTTIAVRLTADRTASEADLADAHAIIESLTYEPQDSTLGFRLLFTLTNDDWNSG